jgi:CIC family chloride channel protein
LQERLPLRPWMDRISRQSRLPALSLAYGVLGGLLAVAFMAAVHELFALVWGRLSALSTAGFLAGSFVAVAASSLLAGVLMTTVFNCPGSGIPDLKASYWRQFGEIPFRAVIGKFLVGVLSIAGGASLGREGPSVLLAGGGASNLARLLGVDRRKRRHATATGAAAGLAAAFNTPLAAVSFVLEELLGDLSSRMVGSVVLGSVSGAFVVYWLVGRQPSFAMPSVGEVSWNVYAVVPFVAASAALAGVAFQRAALGLRLRMREMHRIPPWLRPFTGGMVVWAIGCAVFLWCGRLGVFGLGYDDLSDALLHGIGWKIAGALAIAKLLATVSSYGTGACGGIFSPTLFIGAMCGFCCAGLAGTQVHLTPNDRLVLAATGMGACFGAVTRAPITSILIIFEMTHQFAMVPALMLGTLVSQAIARLSRRRNFYDEILLQDGHEIHRIAPPRDLAGWRAMPVGALAGTKPVAITDYAPEQMRRVLDRHPYRAFPVILGGELRGVTTRTEVENAIAGGRAPGMERPVVCLATESLAEVDSRLIESDAGLYLVAEHDGATPTGVFTLHDILRAQAAVLE